MNYTLEEARAYERRKISDISAEERPGYHLTPACGWLNDPNGFSYYNGKYHLYYQYYPYASHWDAMHWGHWSSFDLLHWTYEPAALAPDQTYETGVFSGSAITDRDGMHFLMYTAHDEKLCADKTVDRCERQCIAKGDGYNFKKYGPVITENDLPEEGDKRDFRDPKIWFEGGKYHAVIALRDSKSGLGEIVLYESVDASHWKYQGVLLKNDGVYGRMWECPDFFNLGEKHVLMISAMNVQGKDQNLRNGFCVLAFLGEYDKQLKKFQVKAVQGLDLGFDCYAAQTLRMPDKRRIMIAWMQAPESGSLAPEGAKWFGMMTFPREIFFRDGKLCQRPIREIEELYEDTVICKDVSASIDQQSEDLNKRWKYLEKVSDRVMDVSLHIQGEKHVTDFRIRCAQKEELYLELAYDSVRQILSVDRSHTNRSADLPSLRELYVAQNQEMNLRILLDEYSFEIFVNDGEIVCSGTIYEMPRDAKGFCICSAQNHISIVKHRLKRVEMQNNL